MCDPNHIRSRAVDLGNDHYVVVIVICIGGGVGALADPKNSIAASTWHGDVISVFRRPLMDNNYTITLDTTTTITQPEQHIIIIRLPSAGNINCQHNR